MAEKKSSVLKDIGIYLPSKAVEGVLGILLLKLYALYMTNDQYGDFSVINQTALIIAVLFSGWLSQSVFRFAKENLSEDKHVRFNSTIFVGMALTTVMGVVVTFIATWLIMGGYDPVIPWVLGMYVFYSFVEMGNLLTTALNMQMFTAGISILRGLFKAILLIILGLMSKNMLTLFQSLMLADVLILVIIFHKTKFLKYVSFVKADKALFMTYFMFGMPIIGTGLNIFLLNSSNRYVIQFLRSKAENGIYTANYSLIAALMQLVFTGIMRAVYPNIVTFWNEGNKQATAKALTLGYRVYYWLVLPLFVGSMVVGKQLTLTFLDAECVDGYVILPWVILAFAFYGISEFAFKGWQLEKNTKPIFWITTVAAVANLLISLVVVPFFGFYGAAVTSAIAFFYCAVAAIIGTRKILRWEMHLMDYAIPALSALLMAVVVYLLGYVVPDNVLGLMLQIGLGGVVYLGGLFVTGSHKKLRS